MEQEILKLVYDYSKDCKIADITFIDKLIEIVVKYRNLNDYVRKVYLTNRLKEKYQTAVYDPLKTVIMLDYESIKANIGKMSSYDYLFDSFEQVLFKNLLVTQSILHELEHAYQHKQADNINDESTETKIIRESFVFKTAINAMRNPRYEQLVKEGKISIKEMYTYMYNKSVLYEHFYILNPNERLAEINSYNEIIKVLEPIESSIPNLFEFNNATLAEKMLGGFEESWEEGICPTQVFLKGIGNYNAWTEFDFYNKDPRILFNNVKKEFNVSKRLSLGLPISKKEYDESVNWLKTTNKYNKN